MRLLIVEDRPKMASLLERALEEEGYACDVAASGEDAVWMAASTEYVKLIVKVYSPPANRSASVLSLSVSYYGKVLIARTAAKCSARSSSERGERT